MAEDAVTFGWREVLIGVVVPGVLVPATVWRVAVLPEGQQSLVGALAVGLFLLSAWWAGRRAVRSMVARRAGEEPASSDGEDAAGLAMVAVGVVLARLVLPDSLVPLLLAIGAGVTTAAVPAYVIAKRRRLDGRARSSQHRDC